MVEALMMASKPNCASGAARYLSSISGAGAARIPGASEDGTGDRRSGFSIRCGAGATGAD